MVGANSLRRFLTLKEEAESKGWLEGPLDIPDIEERSGGKWILVKRFHVVQRGKIRPIDDFSQCAVNDAFGCCERVELRTLDELLWACIILVRHCKHMSAFEYPLSDGAILSGPVSNGWGKTEWVRSIMSVWEPRIPHLVAGAVPHKACSDIWWWIHSQCDLASQTDQVVFGFVQDLRKCYNCLPRLPICRLLIDFGVPPQLVSLWEQALTHVVRYFILGGDTFGPFSSTTGIPEGDPVSVLAMLAFSILWNRAHTDQFTDAPTYADNLELFSRNFTSISNLFESNISFQLAWKQSIAWDKSWVWSNNLPAKSFGNSSCFTAINQLIRTTCLRLPGLLLNLGLLSATHPLGLKATNQHGLCRLVPACAQHCPAPMRLRLFAPLSCL